MYLNILLYTGLSLVICLLAFGLYVMIKDEVRSDRERKYKADLKEEWYERGKESVK